ncbi:putative fatty acyl-CoA reductase, partial [Operophtera brumata]
MYGGYASVVATWQSFFELKLPILYGGYASVVATWQSFFELKQPVRIDPVPCTYIFAEMASSISVREFYKGRCILVTGGTGFMGKVLLEKMLYSIPDIGNIFIIMRPKKGKSAAQRLEDMQRLPLFDRIRNERPSSLNKLKILQGDILLEDFGISSSKMEKLSTEISVVFHFAATLRLEAPLRDNVNMNTSGTQRAINVAKQLKNLVVEPIPGWVDSLNGPVGLMLGAGKGVIRTMLCDGSCTAQKPTTWKEVLEVAKECGRKAPLEWPLWYPNGDITTNATLHDMIRIQDRISKGLDVLQYFTMRSWNFPCPNYEGIRSKLSQEERVIFNTDVTHFDRDTYLETSIE